MKIFCWNLYNRNKRQIQDLEMVLAKNPQVVCLQELREETLDFISEKTDYYMSIVMDYQNKHGEQYYTGILSQSPILTHGLAENIFHKKKVSFASLAGIKAHRELQFVDICHNNQDYRIFNLHLEVACGPRMREQQFQKVFDYWDATKINIICGDLNIFAHPIWNWALGAGFGFNLNELLIDERKHFDQIFDQKKLQNVFANQVTFPRFKLQLDHILLPTICQIKTQKVYNNFGSSDHNLIEVEIGT